MKTSMVVKFWGVRGSIPSPGPSTVRYGGNSPCVSIDLGAGKTLILDAGTGIRKLGETLVKNDSAIFIVLSHTHWDHIQGYPFFLPIYQRDREIHLIPTLRDAAVFNMLFDQMDGAHFPVKAESLPSTCRFVIENALPFLHDHGFDVTRIAANHPGGCFGYRVENDGRAVVYISDNEMDPPSGRVTDFAEFAQFCKGADILIHDSQYTEREMPQKHGWGHSQISQVRDLALAAQVKHLLLFHHDPNRTDDELDIIQEDTRNWLRKQSQVKCTAAFEGLNLEV